MNRQIFNRPRSGFLRVIGLIMVLAMVAHAEPETASEPDLDAVNGSDPAAGTVILFEGQLTRMTSALAPTLREGLVLSGFFSIDLDRVADDQDSSPHGAQFTDVVVDGEFVFDLNHVLIALGSWREDASYLVLTRGGDHEERPSDVYSVTLPMEGEALGEAGWQPLWLQIWLFGEPGRLLSSLRPQLPPERIGSGWFRVIYEDAEGEQATAEGTVTYIGPEGKELSATEQIAQLEAVVADLSARLTTAEAENARAQEHLATADRRIRGLNQTIDLLIEERSALQEELARVQQSQAEADAALTTRIAELEAEQAVLAEARDVLSTINAELARSLAARETDLSAARLAVTRLEAERAAPPGTQILANPVPDSPHPFLAPGQTISSPIRETTSPLRSPQAVPEAAATDPVEPPAAGASEVLHGPAAPEIVEDTEEAFEETVENTSSSPGFVRGPRRFRHGVR